MNERRDHLKKDYFKEFLGVAPVSLALVRALECKYLSELDFKQPILDVGCGDGLFASIFFDPQVDLGIDLSANAVATAKKKRAYKEVMAANAANLPFKDGSFETVFSNCVLEHIPQLDETLKEIARVIKRDGKLIFTVPSDLYGDYLFYSSIFRKIGLAKLGDLYVQKVNSLCAHHNLFSPKIWEQKLSINGLKMESYESYLSPNATKVHDIMIPFALVPLLNKKLFKRMILLHWVRRVLVVPILFNALQRFYEADSDTGSSLLIVATKT